MAAPPPPSRPWWITALIASLVAMVLVTLVMVLPLGRATVVLAVGVLAFGFVLVHNPAFWLRRLAGASIGAALVLAAAPKLTVFLKVDSLGYLLLDGGTSELLIGLLATAGVVFAAIETLAERPPPGPRSLHAGQNIIQGDQNQTQNTTHNAGHDLVVGNKQEIHHHYAQTSEAVHADAERHGVELKAYLTNLLTEVDHIDIKGISTSVRAAMRKPIENLYTPLRSLDLDRDRAEDPTTRQQQPDGAPPEERRVALPVLLHRHHRLLLVGKPGAGKTTFLHLAACMLARDHVDPRPSDQTTWREEHLGLARDRPPPIPALIRLRDLVRDFWDKDPSARQPNDRCWILRPLADKTRPADAARDHGLDQRQQQWDQWLKNGDALLLLDGLDEVADLNLRQRVLAVVRAACDAWPKCQVVVTSRAIDLEAMTAPPLRFHRADIDDFGPEEVQRFVEQWSNALFHRQPSLGADNTRSLVAAIRGRPELRELAKNPVMLTCLCVIHYNEEGELPSGRARVYRAIVRWMLRAREAQRRDHFADAADSLADNALHRLAVAMMEGTARRPGKIAAMDIGDAAAAIEGEIQRYFPNDPAPRDRAERWIRSECELSALVEEVAGNQIKFWHLTIQEFLAAWAIARRSDWWREIERRLDDPQWDKVVDLFSGCVFEAGGRDRVDELVEKILDRGEGEGLRREAETLVHLERVLAPMDAYKYREDHALVIRQKALAERVMAIFTKEGALQVPVKTRIAAAEVIGQWGDPRLAEGVDNFIEIPGTGLRLGKFPVTVGEYGRFIAAGGYQNTRYWDEAGVAWKAEYERIDPWDWDDQQEHPNRPVMGVSWHEARAYCGWLSEGLDGGRRARLPTAAEWEHAATPKTGEYPWGTDQDGANKQLSDEDLAEQFANFKKSVGAPSPVGVCPAGAGPHGHLDLAGNVWEWCEDGDDEDRRWLKGGSWYCDNRGALAAAYRDWNWLVSDFSVSNGFRVVVAREPA